MKMIGAMLLFVASAQMFAQESGVGAIVSGEYSPGYRQRHQFLHAMGEDDLRESAGLLFAFMADGRPPKHMKDGDYLSLCNDIYDKLFALGIYQTELLAHALEVIPDESRMFVWRDYCVQKMAVSLIAPAIEAGERQRGIELLDELTHGRVPAMQGTALIVAHGLSQNSDAVSWGALSQAEVGTRALACAKNNAAALIDRVTALQVAMKCRAEGTLQYARSVIDTETSYQLSMLKVSSIAVLGDLGTEADIELLEKCRRSPDIRMRKSARIALNKLKR